MLNSTSSVSDAAVTGSDTADTESYVDVNMVDDTTHPHLKRGSYYFENDYVELLVAGLTYRVHRHILSGDSPYFVKLFGAHASSEPVELTNVSPAEFDALLAVLYSSCFRSADISTVQEWSAVLRLSTEWSFPAIRALAIRRLESITSPIEKLSLSHAHNIPQWLRIAYIALCMRPTTLTMQEIGAMRVEDLQLIMSTREYLLRTGSTTDKSIVIERVDELVQERGGYPAEDPSTVSEEESDILKPDFIAVERQVRALLAKPAWHDLDSTSRELIRYGSLSDSCTLILGIILYDNAVNDETSSGLYALLSQNISDQLGPASKIKDNGAGNRGAIPLSGSYLFRKFLSNRCQEDFERDYDMEESACATATCRQSSYSQMRCEETGEWRDSHLTLWHTSKDSNRRRNRARFISHLFERGVLTEEFVRDCVKKLIANVEQPNCVYVEGLCTLMSAAGVLELLDKSASRAQTTVWISRMETMAQNSNLCSRSIRMLKDVVELRNKRLLKRGGSSIRLSNASTLVNAV